MTFLADLQELVEFESPSEDLQACRGVIDLARSIMAKHLSGEAKVLEEKGRPVLWWGSDTPKILLLCHLDTVWPIGSFQPLWAVTGAKIAGPGIFDMKAGFLQAVYATAQVNGASDYVAIIATTDEEVGSHASRELIEKVSEGANAVLVLEASLNGKVKVGRKGTSMYQIKVHGRASHAGLEPEKGINATVEAAHLILALTELQNLDLGTTVVPTTLHSGTTTNTVPGLSILDVDIRSFQMDELARVDTAIRKFTAQHPEASIEITGGINRPPLELKSTEHLYNKLELVAQEIGLPPIGSASVGGASDGNFAAAVGAPTLDGLGAVGDGAHAPHEHILAASIPNQISLLTAFIKELIRE